MTYLNPEIIPVPTQDSVDNNYIQDVVGNKTDTHDGTSICGTTKRLDEHVHSASKVCPTLANGITVTTAVGAWVLGSFVEVVPASTITNDFDIHNISFENFSSSGTYELVLYKGAVSSEIEVGRVRAARNSNFDALINQPFQTALIDANERISAKVASNTGSDNVTISIFYHTY